MTRLNIYAPTPQKRTDVLCELHGVHLSALSNSWPAWKFTWNVMAADWGAANTNTGGQAVSPPRQRPNPRLTQNQAPWRVWACREGGSAIPHSLPGGLGPVLHPLGQLDKEPTEQAAASPGSAIPL